MDKLFLGPMSVGDGGDSDVEALQTDVMRFLSIIALCLLAVFAAVSSEPPAAVKAMTEVQASMIASLQEKIAQITTAQSERFEQLEAKNKSLEQLLQQSKDKPNKEPEVDELKQQNLIHRQRINTLEVELQRTKHQQTALERKSKKDKLGYIAQISELQEQLNEKLDDTDPEQIIEPTITEIETTSEPIEQAVSAPPEQKGFTLSFASDQALMALVKRDRVALFADVGEQLWQLDKRQKSFTAVKRVSRFYQLSSVPANILALALNKLKTSQITWGVSFDSQLSAALNRLMTENESGNIVVEQSGKLAIH